MGGVATTEPILETERLRLRPFAPDLADLDTLHSIQSDPEHMRFYPHPFSRDESQMWIERSLELLARRGFSLLAVEDRVTGELLGSVGPTVQNVDGVEEVELGWSIARGRAREGLATEAAIACRDWSFAELDIDYL